MTVKRFEDLSIWKHARELVLDVYKDCKSSATNDYGFQNQITRAAVSVMNNIAEGFERTSDAELANFLNIAKGSCGEVRSMYYIAEDLGYINADTAVLRREKTVILSGELGSFQRYLRNK